MRTPLVLRNLLHNRFRTLLSVAGVCMAVVLIFMQLGFLGAVEKTATLIYDRLEYDVMLRSPDYLHLCDARTIPLAALYAVESHPDIETVTPFHVMLNDWQHPTNFTGNGIILMASRRDQIPLSVNELVEQSERLNAPEHILMDRTTHWDFGPRNNREFGDADIGVRTDIGGLAVQIVGHFELGTGLAAKGAAFTSERGFNRVSLYDTSQHATMGLIRLKPGVTAESFIESLQDQAASSQSVLLQQGAMEALTRDEVTRRELKRWITDTPIGRIFQMGVGLSFIVGATIVYMVLSTDVANRISEYATLNAMGYSQGFMSRLVMKQALLLAVVGYVPGWILTEVLYRLTSKFANIPVEMNGTRMVVVFILAIVMCAISGLLAVRKLSKADPASLF